MPSCMSNCALRYCELRLPAEVDKRRPHSVPNDTLRTIVVIRRQPLEFSVPGIIRAQRAAHDASGKSGRRS
eukprot:328694-Pyramimonas_sp.AAC.1